MREGTESLREEFARRIADMGYGDRWSPFTRLLNDFVELSLSESERLGEDLHATRTRAHDAIELADNLRSAVNEHSRDEEPSAAGDQTKRKQWRQKQGLLWQHNDPEGALYTSETGSVVRAIEKDSLGNVAAQYLQRPWLHHGWFEWMILDALLYSEIVAFARTLKATAPASEGFSFLSSSKHKGNFRAMSSEAARVRLTWRAINFIWVAAQFGVPAYFVWTSPHEPRPWWYYACLAWIGFWLVMVLVEWTSRRSRPREVSQWEKSWALWDKMRAMYNTLPRDAVVSPTQVRSELDRLSQEGAVWPGPAYAIIDHAIRRDPAVWVLNPRSGYVGLSG